LGSLLVGGCAVNGSHPIPSPTDPTYPAYVTQAENDVKQYTTIFTSTYILSQQGKDRVKAAKFANQVAVKVSELSQKELSLKDLQTYAINMVAENASNDDRALVGGLLNAVASLIEDKLNVSFPSLPEDQRVKLGRTLIKDAADKVVELTKPYTMKTQVLTPGAQQLPR
jgi:phosphoketolase